MFKKLFRNWLQSKSQKIWSNFQNCKLNLKIKNQELSKFDFQDRILKTKHFFLSFLKLDMFFWFGFLFDFDFKRFKIFENCSFKFRQLQNRWNFIWKVQKMSQKMLQRLKKRQKKVTKHQKMSNQLKKTPKNVSKRQIISKHVKTFQKPSNIPKNIQNSRKNIK